MLSTIKYQLIIFHTTKKLISQSIIYYIRTFQWQKNLHIHRQIKLLKTDYFHPKSQSNLHNKTLDHRINFINIQPEFSTKPHTHIEPQHHKSTRNDLPIGRQHKKPKTQVKVFTVSEHSLGNICFGSALCRGMRASNCTRWRAYYFHLCSYLCCKTQSKHWTSVGYVRNLEWARFAWEKCRVG